MRYFVSSLVLAVGLNVATSVWSQDVKGLRAPAREANVPNTRWTHQPDHLL